MCTCVMSESPSDVTLLPQDLNDLSPKKTDSSDVDLLDYDMDNMRYLFVLQMRETDELKLSMTVTWCPSQQKQESQGWYTWFSGVGKSGRVIPLLVINNNTAQYMNELAAINEARGAQRCLTICVYPLPGARFALKHIHQSNVEGEIETCNK